MKGSLELLTAMAVLFVFGFVIIFVQVFLQAVDTTATPLLSANALTILDSVEQGFYVFDNGFLILTIGIFLSLLVSVFYIETNPVYFVVFLILLFIDVFFAPIISNVFLEFASAPEIVGVANNYPITVQFFQNLPVIVLFTGVVMLIVLYAKRQGASV